MSLCVPSVWVLRSVPVSSHLSQSEPEETEVVSEVAEEVAKEDPSPSDAVATHMTLDPSYGAEVRYSVFTLYS